jgi:hypothetical protein
MTVLRSGATLLAALLCAVPAVADEYVTYHQLEVVAPGDPSCRVGMLASLPPSWSTGDGAAVLVTLEPADHAMRDMLVSALLHERAAVLELAPQPCAARPGDRDGVVAAASGALDAMRRGLGAGLVLAIGYGPGSSALLPAARDTAVGPDGAADRPRYAAAIALGDGEATFVPGPPQPPAEGAAGRLALLCRAMAGVAEGMGESPRRDASALTATACREAIASDGPGTARVRPVASRP